MLAAVKPRAVSVTEFKAKCLSLLGDVAERGSTITVTKRGRPVAIIRPARRDPWKSPEGAFVGKITLDDDLLDADSCNLWKVARRLPEPRRLILSLALDVAVRSCRTLRICSIDDALISGDRVINK